MIWSQWKHIRLFVILAVLSLFIYTFAREWVKDLKAIERGKKLKVDPSLTRGKPFNCIRYRKTIRGFKEPSRRFKGPRLFKYCSLFKSHTLLRLFLKISNRPGPGWVKSRVCSKKNCWREQFLWKKIVVDREQTLHIKCPIMQNKNMLQRVAICNSTNLEPITRRVHPPYYSYVTGFSQTGLFKDAF